MTQSAPKTPSDPAGQVHAARHAALAIPASDLSTLVVTGEDRVTWLNGLVTCDLIKRPDGEARYGLFAGRNGRVLSDVIVVVDAEGGRALALMPAARVETLRAHLEHYLVMEDAEMAPRSDAFDPWMIHGPRSGDVLAAARSAGAIGGSLDRTGLGGAVVLVPTEDAGVARVARAAIEAAVQSVDGRVGDDAGWEALRLERAVARFGFDFDEKTYPQEASLEKTAVSFDKGCYLGQEVVCMLEMRGHVNRKLVAMVVDSDAPPARGAAVADEKGAAAGEVTSAASSPTLGRTVALAMVKRAFAAPESRVVVGGASGHVVERPA